MENMDPNLSVPSQPTPPLPDSPQLQPQVFTPPPQPPRAPKKNLIIGSVALVVLVAAAGAAAYTYYPPSPEKLASRMQANFTAVKTAEFALKMDMEVKTTLASMPDAPDAGPRQVKISMEMEGASDESDANNPKFYGVMKMTGEGLVVSADLRTIGKTVYVKLNEAPFLGFIDPGKIKNQWIRIDTAELEKQLGSSTQGYSSLTEDDEKLIQSLYENSKIIKFEKRLASETVNSVSTYHYDFTVDEVELKTFALRVLEITNKQMTTEDKAMFEKSLDQVEFEPGQIWIGRKDSLPYKVSLNVNFKGNEQALAEGKIALTINFKNYNKPVTVEVPSNSTDFKDLFGELLGGLQPQELPPIPIPTN